MSALFAKLFQNTPVADPDGVRGVQAYPPLRQIISFSWRNLENQEKKTN